MKLIQALLWLLISLPVLAAPDDVAEIEKLYADWRSAVLHGDIPSYVAVLDPEVRLIPPGAEVINGAAHYAQFLKPVFEAATYRIEVVKPATIEVLDDIAVAEYEYIIHLELKDPSTGITEAGALTDSRTQARYFDVLRKNAAGEFRIWRHTWQTR